MGETLTAAFNLTDVQRKELVTLINYIQGNDKRIKSNLILQRFLLEKSEYAIQWPDVQIAQFKDRPSSLSLPERADHQHLILQILNEKARNLGYGKNAVTIHEGTNPELYAEMVKIFGIKPRDPYEVGRRSYLVSVADFDLAFKNETKHKINLDRFRDFLKGEGRYVYRLPQNARDDLLSFAKKCNRGEVQFKPNILTGKAPSGPT